MSGGKFMGWSQAHHECWELLPWIANDRASASDFARVESHLRECRECSDELEAQRRLREAIRAEEAVVLAPQTSLHKLMQRIDGETSVEPPAEVPVRPAEQPFWRRTSWLATAAAIQAVMITGLLGALWWQSRDALTAPRYVTLTSQANTSHAPVLRVVFAKGVEFDEVNEILRSIDAQIIAGPSEAGVYTLGLDRDAAGTPEVQNALARLRADARVLFSETTGTPTQSR